MTKRFLTPINLVNLSSDPATGSEGDLYFNTTDNVVKIYVDGVWTELQGGGGGGASVLYMAEQPDVTGLEIGTIWVDSNASVSGGGGGSGGGPSFRTISTSPSSQVITALTTTENLEFVAGENVSIIADDTNNTVTINSTGNYTSVDSIQYPDYIVFDTTPENTSASVSTLSWDSGESSLSLQLNANTNVTLGQELIVKVYNAEASTITKGQVVYLFGAQGQRPSVKLASNASDTTSAKTFGIAAENITSGAEGLIVSQGLVKNINTNGFNEGDVLWLGNTPGSLTTTKPQGPLHGVFVGVVVKKNASSGRIYVKAQNGYELDELHDVRITSAQNDDLIVYNSASSIWINSPKQDIINTASAAAVAYLVDGAPAALDTLNELAAALDDNADVLDLYLTQSSASTLYEPNIPYVSASPSTPTAGTLWIDSTNSAAPALKVYNGTTWIAVSGAASESGFHPFFGAYK